MDARLRTAVWDLMIETDRMARYHGYLAGKLSKREKIASIITTSLGVVSAYSVANSIVDADRWAWAAIAFSTATVAASVVPLVYRYGDAISAAAYCQTRLDSLSTKCKELWLLRDAIDEDEAISRWRALEGEQTEITAFQSARPLDHKLAVSTREETDAYWKQEADRLNRIGKKGRNAIRTAGQGQSIEGGSDATPAQA